MDKKLNLLIAPEGNLNLTANDPIRQLFVSKMQDSLKETTFQTTLISIDISILNFSF